MTTLICFKIQRKMSLNVNQFCWFPAFITDYANGIIYSISTEHTGPIDWVSEVLDHLFVVSVTCKQLKNYFKKTHKQTKNKQTNLPVVSI